MEGWRRSIASRWSRETEKSVEGKIESRGVTRLFRLVVSPEPELKRKLLKDRAAASRKAVVEGRSARV